MKGSLFPMTSPMVLPNYQEEFSLVNLPNAGLNTKAMIFAYTNQDELIFLFTDGEKNAVKYNILKDSHRKIPSSKYPIFDDLISADPFGLRVGDYFWVIGGRPYKYLPHIGPELGRLSTTLWSIKKEKWIRGPELPEDLLEFDIIYKAVCAVSVGSNTAFILNPNTMYSFNFTDKMGRFYNSPPGISTKDTDYLISCTFHMSKDYQRLVMNALTGSNFVQIRNLIHMYNKMKPL